MPTTPFDDLMNTLVVVKNQVYLMQRMREFDDQSLQILKNLSDAERQIIHLQTQHSQLVNENDALKATLHDMAQKLVAAYTQDDPVLQADDSESTKKVRHKCVKCGMMCVCITESCSKCSNCHLREMRATQIAGDGLSDSGGFRSGYW